MKEAYAGAVYDAFRGSGLEEELQLECPLISEDHKMLTVPNE